MPASGLWSSPPGSPSSASPTFSGSKISPRSPQKIITDDKQLLSRWLGKSQNCWTIKTSSACATLVVRKWDKLYWNSIIYTGSVPHMTICQVINSELLVLPWLGQRQFRRTTITGFPGQNRLTLDRQVSLLRRRLWAGSLFHHFSFLSLPGWHNFWGYRWT